MHTSLVSVGHDLLHGAFHFEGRIWRTMPELLLRPGRLTRRYIDGERAKFVSPLALFLFAVLLMLAVFENVGSPFGSQALVLHNGHRLSPAEVRTALGASRSRQEHLRRALASLSATDPRRSQLEGRILNVEAQVQGYAIADRLNTGDSQAAAFTRWHPDTGWSSIDERLRNAFANPALLGLKLQTQAHKFAWGLIPLSLPFLCLAFAWRREYRPYDHVVFIAYSLAAVMLVLVAMALLARMGLSTGWMLLLIPLHQYRQLHGAYAIGRWGAIWRTAWLQTSAFVVLLLFGLALVVAGLMD